MTQPDHAGRRSPRRRACLSRPASARPGGRRGGDRRPWPTAPATTRVSPAKPAADMDRSRSSGAASAPTPATVWTAGADPIDLDATWPTALLERVVTSFSHPAARVVLLARSSTPEHTHRTLRAVRDDGVVDRAPGTEQDVELVDAVAAVERLDRAVRVEHVPVDPVGTGPGSRPFRTNPSTGRGAIPALAEAASEEVAPDLSSMGFDGVDLIVTSLPPWLCGDRSVDLVALHAARRLRIGGILAVLTHCDWTRGELTDPTGAVVAAGQNADLLYLQHIVALHAPVRDGSFHLPHTPTAGGGEAEEAARARHRAQVRGLPVPHRRIHSDVLVFVQPHDHQPPPARRAAAAANSGGHR
ncbi:hypothetical protein [Actinokineospora sp. NPDC004072]